MRFLMGRRIGQYSVLNVLMAAELGNGHKKHAMSK